MRTKKLVTFTLLLGLIAFAHAGRNLSGLIAPQGVPTFESIGLSVAYTGDDNKNGKCVPRYRKKGTTTWKNGNMLVHATKGRIWKGSLVHLQPGTAYEVEVTCTDPDGGKITKTGTFQTWPEKFPEGPKVIVKNRTTTLNVDRSGMSTAYRVYRPETGQSAVIDVNKRARNCVYIDADYVIVRGLIIKNSKSHAIKIAKGRHHVVIEGCDISEFGPNAPRGAVTFGNGSAIYYDEGEVFVGNTFVIQDNVIHHPSTGGYGNRGSNAIVIMGGDGNHVIRHNKVYSDTAKYFGAFVGFNYHQSSNNCEIYNNQVSECLLGVMMGAFAENARMWGNVFNEVAQCFRHTTPHPNWDFRGPWYIWRNLFSNIRRPDSLRSPGMLAVTEGPGRIHFYNNTLLYVNGASARADSGLNANNYSNYVVKNNIMDCRFPLASFSLSPRNLLDYNLYRQAKANLGISSAWEKNGVFGKIPTYNKQGSFAYYLQTGSAGVDKGGVIPNFAETYSGSAPDVGAFENNAFAFNPGPRPGTLPVYPNPNGIRDGWNVMTPNFQILPSGQNGFTVSSVSGTPVVFSMFDMQGRLVQTSTESGSASSVLWVPGRTASGTYYLRIKAGQQSFYRKAIVVR